MTLEEALILADGHYWSVAVTFSGADGMMWADRGDSNCPHRKLYDPTDHHGYECTEETIFNNMEELIEWIAKLPPIGTAYVKP